MTVMTMVPQATKAESTVQNFGSSSDKSWTSTSSTTNIAATSTVTIDGVVMTFGGSNWTWNSSNSGLLPDNMVYTGTNTPTTSFTAESALPTQGGYLVFTASKAGTLTITGKDSQNSDQKVIWVTLNSDNSIKTVVSESYKSVNSSSHEYTVEAGVTYYFFQLAKEFSGYRYTLKGIAFAEPTEEVADPESLTTINAQTIWDFEQSEWASRSTTTAEGAVYDNLWLSGTATYNNTETRMELSAGTANRMKFKVAQGQKGYVVVVANGTDGVKYGVGSNATVSNTSAICQGSIYKVTTSSLINADTDKDVLIHAPAGNAALIKKIAWIPSSQAGATVTLGTAGFSTFCPTTTVSIPSGVKAYILNSCDGTTATWKEITSTIPGFTGVLLVGEGGTGYTFSTSSTSSSNTYGTNAYGPTSAWYDTTSNSQNILVGTYKDTSIPASTTSTSYYGLVKNTNTFGKVTADVTMATGLAYFSVEGSNNAREITLDFGSEDTTGIKIVDNGQKKKDNVFNLAGQLITQPSKGLYIVNGKKVIVK